MKKSGRLLRRIRWSHDSEDGRRAITKRAWYSRASLERQWVFSDSEVGAKDSADLLDPIFDFEPVTGRTGVRDDSLCASEIAEHLPRFIRFPVSLILKAELAIIEGGDVGASCICTLLSLRNQIRYLPTFARPRGCPRSRQRL